MIPQNETHPHHVALNEKLRNIDRHRWAQSELKTRRHELTLTIDQQRTDELTARIAELEKETDELRTAINESPVSVNLKV
jgi:hypothetical protein